MTTICQIKESSNPARDIVEGRRKPQAVVPVPLTIFKCESAPPDSSVTFFAGISAAAGVRTFYKGKFPVLMEKFYRQHRGPFTKQDVEAFAEMSGYEGSADGSLQNWVSLGKIKRVGQRHANNSKHLISIYEPAGQPALTT